MSVGYWILFTIIVIGLFFLTAYIIQVSLDYIIPDIKASSDTTYDRTTYQPLSYWTGVLLLVLILISFGSMSSNTVFLDKKTMDKFNGTKSPK